MNRSVLLGIIASAATVTTLAFAVASDTMVPNEYLFPRQSIAASGCFYHLDMQTDGNLVTYGNSRAAWASGTSNNKGGYAVFQTDGNFVIYNWNDSPVWHTRTSGFPGARVVQQSDGNLVVYNAATPLWASGVSGESIGQSPCSFRTNKTQVINNADRAGGDFADIIPRNTAGAIVARASFCGYYCAADSRCRAYTYVPPGAQDSNPHCMLKSFVPGVLSRSGFVSGKILNN